MTTPSRKPKQTTRADSVAPKPGRQLAAEPEGDDRSPTGVAAEPRASRGVSAEERWQMVARAAYFRAEQRGFAAGSALQDWLEAEREIDALLGP